MSLKNKNELVFVFGLYTTNETCKISFNLYINSRCRIRKMKTIFDHDTHLLPVKCLTLRIREQWWVPTSWLRVIFASFLMYILNANLLYKKFNLEGNSSPLFSVGGHWLHNLALTTLVNLESCIWLLFLQTGNSGHQDMNIALPYITLYPPPPKKHQALTDIKNSNCTLFCIAIRFTEDAPTQANETLA